MSGTNYIYIMQKKREKCTSLVGQFCCWCNNQSMLVSDTLSENGNLVPLCPSCRSSALSRECAQHRMDIVSSGGTEEEYIEFKRDFEEKLNNNKDKATEFYVKDKEEIDREKVDKEEIDKEKQYLNDDDINKLNNNEANMFGYNNYVYPKTEDGWIKCCKDNIKPRSMIQTNNFAGIISNHSYDCTVLYFGANNSINVKIVTAFDNITKKEFLNNINDKAADKEGFKTIKDFINEGIVNHSLWKEYLIANISVGDTINYNNNNRNYIFVSFDDKTRYIRIKDKYATYTGEIANVISFSKDVNIVREKGKNQRDFNNIEEWKTYLKETLKEGSIIKSTQISLPACDNRKEYTFIAFPNEFNSYLIVNVGDVGHDCHGQLDIRNGWYLSYQSVLEVVKI